MLYQATSKLNFCFLHCITLMSLSYELFPLRLFFLIAEICLLAGSVRNAYHTKYRGIIGGDSLSCSTLRKGVFGAGAAFIFFTAIVSEFYYVFYSKARESFQQYGREPAVGMGTYKWALLRSSVHDRYFANRCDRVDSLICTVHCLCLSFISCSRCSI